MSIWLFADLILLALVAVLGYLSMKKGFLKSSFGGVSRFIALILVFSLHASFAAYLSHSVIGDTVRSKILTNIEASLLANPDINSAESENDAAEKAVDGMKLSGFLSEWIKNAVKAQKDNYENFRQNLAESITDIIFPFAMQIISVLLLYALIRLCLWGSFFALKMVTEIPMFGMADRLLGALTGGFNALLIIYIIASLIMLFTPPDSVNSVEMGINSTYIFKYFYNNNMINLLFFK